MLFAFRTSYLNYQYKSINFALFKIYHYDSNMKNLKIYSMGVDIGSTTIKVAILDDEGNLKFSDYRRHNANIRQAAREIAIKMYHKSGNCKLDIVITGSVGMGYSSKLDYVLYRKFSGLSNLLERQDDIPQPQPSQYYAVHIQFSLRYPIVCLI